MMIIIIIVIRAYAGRQCIIHCVLSDSKLIPANYYEIKRNHVSVRTVISRSIRRLGTAEQHPYIICPASVCGVCLRRAVGRFLAVRHTAVVSYCTSVATSRTGERSWPVSSKLYAIQNRAKLDFGSLCYK